MVILKDFLKTLDDQAVVKIKLKNADLIESQVCDLKLNQYKKLESQVVINIDCDLMKLDKDIIKYFILTLDYELKFGVDDD